MCFQVQLRRGHAGRGMCIAAEETQSVASCPWRLMDIQGANASFKLH